MVIKSMKSICTIQEMREPYRKRPLERLGIDEKTRVQWWAIFRTAMNLQAL
jgi:hypothetical protein